MSLTVVSVPIGNFEDITVRAAKTLSSCDAIICEELKPAKILLKHLGLGEKRLYQLNEHTPPDSIRDLVKLCRAENIALISDAGTPGFCDPGAILVQMCYSENTPVDVNPGVSSLMTLIGISGVDLKEFHFVGFLPAEKEKRLKKLATYKTMKIPFIIMDTPYRLDATVKEVAHDFPSSVGVLGVDLTGPAHKVMKARMKEIAEVTWEKHPFVLLVVP